MLSSTAIFVDCNYLHKDIYEILYNSSIVLRERNYGLFLLVRQRLNEALVFIRDDLNLCDYVPEIDIVFKNQMSLYSKPFEEANLVLRGLEGDLQEALSKNLDGSMQETQFRMIMPTLMNLESQDSMT